MFVESCSALKAALSATIDATEIPRILLTSSAVIQESTIFPGSKTSRFVTCNPEKEDDKTGPY